jgi:hypothetical protein
MSPRKELAILKDILFEDKVEKEKSKGALELISRGFPIKDVLESLEISPREFKI